MSSSQMQNASWNLVFRQLLEVRFNSDEKVYSWIVFFLDALGDLNEVVGV